MPLGSPVLSLTAQVINDPSFPYVELTLQCTDMTMCTISRITPEGIEPVRGMENVAPLAPGPPTFYGADYEVPQSDTLSYMAIASDGVSTVTVPQVDIPGIDRGGDFIFPLGRPNEAMKINVKGVSNVVHEISQAVGPVLNRPDPVVVSFGRHFYKGTVELITLTDTERLNFMRIVATGRPVVFCPRPNYGYEDIQYLAFGRVEEQRPSTAGGEQARVWSCEVQRIARPPASFTVTVGNTWQWVKDTAGVTGWLYYVGGYDWQTVAGI